MHATLRGGLGTSFIVRAQHSVTCETLNSRAAVVTGLTFADGLLVNPVTVRLTHNLSEEPITFTGLMQGKYSCQAITLTISICVPTEQRNSTNSQETRRKQCNNTEGHVPARVPATKKKGPN